ncbi:MAG: PspC domain-containing protein [Prevotellaceae bacterium]|jgi:phage shock protein PspC (stress-responsive transcriptional regulator)|nr:PspC domain-containing protein [Prevotellaceae bacterium]
MKKVITANIGGKSFIIDEDAFALLQDYLEYFKATITDPKEVEEVMTDIEIRMAEMLQECLRNEMQSVNCAMVDVVITQLGKPKGWKGDLRTPGRRRLYRDPDHRLVGGVCSGIAAFFGFDIALVRLGFLLSLLFVLTGLWVYLILWIVVPPARTMSEKLEMRGEPATAENIRNIRQ